MTLPKLKLRRPKFPAILRWRYVLPRLAILAALYAAVHWGLDPALKYAVVASGEAALGAKVEVADLATSILDGEIVVTGFAAANPSKPMRNLVEAEQTRLKLDFSALLHKRLVVEDGLVRGVRFDSERMISGAIETAPESAEAGPSMFDPAIAAASDAAVEWFVGLQGRLEEDLESKLATPRVARELEVRWQRQYEALRQRADELAARAKQLERDVREAKKNPLRSIELLAGLQQQLVATQSELKTTLAEIKDLPAQAQADRVAIDAARKQDQQFLQDALVALKTDKGQLTEYLLGETAYGYLTESVGWVQYVRSWIPKSKMERPARARGTNVLFADRRRPKLLVERVTLTGSARLGGQPLELTGLLTDATTEPEFHDRPLQLHLQSSGGVAGSVLVTIDRRGGAAHDTLVLDCPSVLVGERTLGKADALAVTVAPGAASIKAELTLDGDQLVGVIRVRQSSTLAAATPKLRDDRIAAMLADSLRGVDRLEATINLSGTLRRPKCQIESNLGGQLADGMSGALRKYLAERRDRLAAKVQARVDEQLARLDAKRQEAQAELLAKLGENQQVVEQVAAVMGGQVPLDPAAIPQLGSKLHLDRLKR
jgi:uncharacterized protein (TIGR03545 family)